MKAKLTIILLLLLTGCNQTLEDMDYYKTKLDEELNQTNEYLEVKKEGLDELEQKTIKAYVKKMDEEYEKRMVEEYLAKRGG